MTPSSWRTWTANSLGQTHEWRSTTCRVAGTADPPPQSLSYLAQTAYTLLSDVDEADMVQTAAAKAEFLRRKVKTDETWDKKQRRSTSILFQRPVPLMGRDGVRATCSSLSI